MLSKKAVNADIRSYVDHEPHQRPDFIEKKTPYDLLEQILNQVGDRTDWMFRWAVCQLDSLAKCLHPQAIRKALRILPRDLDETYECMLQSIPPELKDDAFRLLQFLVHARRPLTVSEAVDVIATLIEKGQGQFNAKRRLLLNDDILCYCPNLLSIAEVTRDEVTVKEVQLAYFLVKEYLLNQSQFTIEMASSAIVRTCFTYIRGIDCSLRTIGGDFPLDRYAAEITMEHARLAESSNETVQETVAFFQEKATVEIWRYLYQPDQPWNDEPEIINGQGLYYSCLNGLSRASGCLIDRGADINAQGDECGNALQAASCHGHQETVQLLLDRGADVNEQGGRYGNALYAASSGGHHDIVQLLLGKDANVNAQDGDYGNGLQTASSEGHHETVQLLVEKGAGA